MERDQLSSHDIGPRQAAKGREGRELIAQTGRYAASVAAIAAMIAHIAGRLAPRVLVLRNRAANLPPAVTNPFCFSLCRSGRSGNFILVRWLKNCTPAAEPHPRGASAAGMRDQLIGNIIRSIKPAHRILISRSNPPTRKEDSSTRTGWRKPPVEREF